MTAAKSGSGGVSGWRREDAAQRRAAQRRVIVGYARDCARRHVKSSEAVKTVKLAFPGIGDAEIHAVKLAASRRRASEQDNF